MLLFKISCRVLYSHTSMYRGFYDNERVCIELHDICIHGMHVTYLWIHKGQLVHLTQILIVSCTQTNSNVPIGFIGSFPSLLSLRQHFFFPAACLAVGRAFLESHSFRRRRSDGIISMFCTLHGRLIFVAPLPLSL